MTYALNQILLAGAIAREPELRYTPSGTPVFEATVAGEQTMPGTDGRERKIPWYHKVTVLGRFAEILSERGFKAGDEVLVDGSIEYSEWQAQEGGKRSLIRVKANRFDLVMSADTCVNDAGGSMRLAGGWNATHTAGNLTRDPELRYTPTGQAVIDLALAVNESWKDKHGAKQEKTHFITATAWGDLAERLATLKKGDPVVVRGALLSEAWTDRDGNKRTTVKIEAVDVKALARASAAAVREPVAAGARSAATRPAPAAPPAFPQEEEDLPF